MEKFGFRAKLTIGYIILLTLICALTSGALRTVTLMRKQSYIDTTLGQLLATVNQNESAHLHKLLRLKKLFRPLRLII